MNGVSQASEAEQLVQVSTDCVTLEGDLEIPGDVDSIVLFAHGSGSSRRSPRNQFVAEALREGGLATLLIDLLTPEEKDVDRWTRQFRFDIDRLARRIVGATDWLSERPDTQGLHIGYFGSSTGAAGALIAAAERPDAVEAVVSRGGRADMAEAALGRVRAPTLLIVGGNDPQVIELNRYALAQLRSETRLEIIPGASHLFEEPGALEEVARLARQWFQRHLRASPS